MKNRESRSHRNAPRLWRTQETLPNRTWKVLLRNYEWKRQVWQRMSPRQLDQCGQSQSHCRTHCPGITRREKGVCAGQVDEVWLLGDKCLRFLVPLSRKFFLHNWSTPCAMASSTGVKAALPSFLHYCQHCSPSHFLKICFNLSCPPLHVCGHMGTWVQVSIEMQRRY